MSAHILNLLNELGKRENVRLYARLAEYFIAFLQ